MDGMSLLDVLRGVMLDPAEQAAYNANPAAYLGRYGYEDVDPADLSEAFGLVADTLPPEQAQVAWQAASTPDGDAFGAVTADFDSDGGLEEPAVDLAGPEVAVADDPYADTTLSFGQGEAADGPPAPDAVVPDPAEGSPGDGEPGEPGDGAFGPEAGPGAEVDDEGGFGLDADDGPDDDGLDDGPDDYEDALDDDGGGYDDGGLDDDFGELDQIDGLDELSIAGPDDTDIGSF
jgi:hypothetical protein